MGENQTQNLATLGTSDKPKNQREDGQPGNARKHADQVNGVGQGLQYHIMIRESRETAMGFNIIYWT